MKLRLTIRYVLAILAWIGLTLAPLTTPASAKVAPMEMAITDIEAAAVDMSEGMPCCPDTQNKPDCAQDCPLMVVCAVKIFPSAAGAAVAAPLSFAMFIVPRDAAKLSGFAQAPPPRPPKA